MDAKEERLEVGGPDSESTLTEWQRRVRELEQRGRYFQMYDVATRALGTHPDDVRLQSQAVLALARSGATEMATKQYAEFDLGSSADEDIAALGARLAKDRVWRASGTERARLAGEAAARYRAVYTRTGGYFPGINEATLLLFAGDAPGACAAARRTLKDLESVPNGNETYYERATSAEAHLLLGDLEAARSSLEKARALAGGDLGALATTRRQLRRICEHMSVDTAWLSVIGAGNVVHYCGHMIAAPGEPGRFPAADEMAVRDAIVRSLEENDVGFGFGALACGADILFAEALIARDAELNVVFPFDSDEFEAVSVRRGGPGWRERFHRCLEQADSVHFATEDSYLGDDALFGYASRYAMGLAQLRARELDTDVMQVAVWDGASSTGTAGTASDVEVWRSQGFKQRVIPLAGATHAESVAASPGFGFSRTPRAMLFGDFKGFSKLQDRQLPSFVDVILGTVARCLDEYEDSIRLRNTWGDGLYLVFDDPRMAARCALGLQEALGNLNQSDRGLPSTLSLRLGGHYGPIYEGTDPVTRSVNYFGAHVSRAARIEPITPVGCVYVSEPFAASLALEGSDEFNCEYVGTVPMAKAYGELPMYLLRRG